MVASSSSAAAAAIYTIPHLVLLFPNQAPKKPYLLGIHCLIYKEAFLKSCASLKLYWRIELQKSQVVASSSSPAAAICIILHLVLYLPSRIFNLQTLLENHFLVYKKEIPVLGIEIEEELIPAPQKENLIVHHCSKKQQQTAATQIWCCTIQL